MRRLKTRNQFQAVLAGERVAATAHFALHRCGLGVPGQVPGADGSAPGYAHRLFDADDVWMGAMVPKRWAKRAVTRNAIKRQIYNVSDLFESALPLAAHVVRLRSGFERSKFVSATSTALKQALRSELEQLFSRVARGPARSPAPQPALPSP